jgi:protein-S-isoprenylcysteine O-methyltransferase Ste14
MGAVTEPSGHKKFPQDSRLRDLLAGLPLILFCGFGLAGFIIVIPGQWTKLHPPYPLILSEMTSALFLGLQLVLLFIRRLPLNKSPGLLPRIWALAGANFGYALLLFPKVPLSSGWALVSAFVVLAGTLGSVGTLIWLGRAFSIFPQARQLVMRGPYSVVRHPLYLFEQLAMLGVSLQFVQPWGLLMVAASFALQFPRMDYEEKILAETFPEYELYARSTPRLIPALGPF